jgi:hypothetical protein
MAKKTNPDKPTEIPSPEKPEITPETVPSKPTGPFEEPEIVPEEDPGGTSPGEIPVPEPGEEPGKQDEPLTPKGSGQWAVGRGQKAEGREMKSR